MPGFSRLPTVGALGAAPDVLAALRAAGATVVAVDAGDGAAAEAATALAASAEVVVVDGPVGERAGAARAAVDAGAHVFLAWPPGVSADEAAALVARAEEAGVDVGVARPLPVAALLAGLPTGWTARVASLALDASAAGSLARIPPAHRLAGMLDLGTSLAGSADPARLDAAADGGLTTVALRLRTGVSVALTLRDAAESDALRLVASGGGTTVEARTLDGPLCVDGAAPVPVEPVHEAVAFLHAVAAGRRAPFSLDRALATMRLVELVRARLR